MTAESRLEQKKYCSKVDGSVRRIRRKSSSGFSDIQCVIRVAIRNSFRAPPDHPPESIRNHRQNARPGAEEPQRPWKIPSFASWFLACLKSGLGFASAPNVESSSQATSAAKRAIGVMRLVLGIELGPFNNGKITGKKQGAVRGAGETGRAIRLKESTL